MAFHLREVAFDLEWMSTRPGGKSRENCFDLVEVLGFWPAMYRISVNLKWLWWGIRKHQGEDMAQTAKGHSFSPYRIQTPQVPNNLLTLFLGFFRDWSLLHTKAYHHLTILPIHLLCRVITHK